MATGLFSNGLFLAADPLITTSLLVIGLTVIILVIAGIIFGFKAYLNNRSEKLLQELGSAELDSPLVRKHPALDTFKHSATFFWTGSIATLALCYMLLNWTNITEHFKLDLGDLEVPEELMTEPPITPPTPPPPTPPTPPTTPTTQKK